MTFYTALYHNSKYKSSIFLFELYNIICSNQNTQPRKGKYVCKPGRWERTKVLRKERVRYVGAQNDREERMAEGGSTLKGMQGADRSEYGRV